MSPRPVAEFLTCFGNELIETIQEIESEPILFASPETPEELGDLVEEARSQGISEGFASAEAALEYKLEEQRLFFEERLAAEKASWRCETAASISNQIKVAIEDMEASFAESAKRILRPFVVKALIDKLAGELCESVKTLLCDKELSFIEIRGPEYLVDELRSSLAVFQAIKFVQSDSPEVRIFTNKTMVETRVSTWLDRISIASE